MQTFQAGKTYATRSIGDSNCVIRLTVVKRTAKTITADCGRGEVKTLRIGEYDGREQVKPWGSYSMAPIIDASDLA